MVASHQDLFDGVLASQPVPAAAVAYATAPGPVARWLAITNPRCPQPLVDAAALSDPDRYVAAAAAARVSTDTAAELWSRPGLPRYLREALAANAHSAPDHLHAAWQSGDVVLRRAVLSNPARTLAGTAAPDLAGLVSGLRPPRAQGLLRSWFDLHRELLDLVDLTGAPLRTRLAAARCRHLRADHVAALTAGRSLHIRLALATNWHVPPDALDRVRGLPAGFLAAHARLTAARTSGDPAALFGDADVSVPVLSDLAGVLVDLLRRDHARAWTAPVARAVASDDVLGRHLADRLGLSTRVSAYLWQGATWPVVADRLRVLPRASTRLGLDATQSLHLDPFAAAAHVTEILGDHPERWATFRDLATHESSVPVDVQAELAARLA